MRVDRPGNRKLPGASEDKPHDSPLQKKGNKVTLHAGDEDTINISQSQNSLKIQINQDPPIQLSADDSKNLQITGNLSKVTVDSDITIPIKGFSQEPKQEAMPKDGVSRKEERALTGQMTREILVSELKNYMAEKGDVPQPKIATHEGPPKEQIAMNLNTLRAPDAGTPPLNAQTPHLHAAQPEVSEATAEEFTPLAADVNRESSLTAKIKKDDLSNELGVPSPPTNSHVAQPLASEVTSEEFTPLTGDVNHENSLSAKIKKEDLSNELGVSSSPTHVAQPLASEVTPEEFAPLTGDVNHRNSLSAKIKRDDLSDEHGVFGPRPRNSDGATPAPVVASGQSDSMEPSGSSPKNELFDFIRNKPSTPEAKASLFTELANEPKFSLFEERGIQSILSDAQNASEFREMLPDFAGFQIGHTLQHPEMRTMWNRLVVAFDRPELALNQSDAAKFQGLFAQDPETLQRLAPECTAHFLSPEAAPDELRFLDPASFVCVVLENHAREIEHQPLLQPAELRQNALEILTDGSLSQEEKLFGIEQLKQESGLSDFQMREIVTRPLSTFLQTAIGGVLQERDSVIQTMDAKVREASDSFGPDSVAVEITKAEHQETLEHLDSRAQRFSNLQIIADSMFAGPHDLLVQADRGLESVINTFFPARQMIEPEINKIFNGAVAFQTGKLEQSFQSIRSSIPELKPFVEPASLFVQNIRNGQFPALLIQLSSHPALSKETALMPQFVNAAKFLAQLATGTFARQMQASTDVFKDSIPQPLKQIVSRVQQWRSEVSSRTDYDGKQRLMKEIQPLQQELVGLLQTNLPVISQTATAMFEDHRFQSAMETVQTGADVVVAFRNGNFEQILATLKQRLAGSAAVKQIIEQALHIINGGTPFFRGLLNREWERPLFSALKKGSASKELQEVPGIFTDTLNLFLPLTSVEDSSPFLEYQRQLSYLKDEELMQDWIHQYRSENQI